MVTWLLYIALCFYNFVDAWNTVQGLSMGLKEINPLMIYLIDLFGPIPALFGSKIIVLVIVGILLFIYGRNI